MNNPITFGIKKNPIVFGGGQTFTAPGGMDRGVAYTENGFFVCLYGYRSGLRGIAPGISFTQKAVGQISDWVKATFDAHDIKEMKRRPGECTKLLWRPGIDGRDQVLATLVPDVALMNEAGVSLSLLFSRFEEISLFIQPDASNLDVYGHQLRELLILACTEVESSLRAVFAGADSSLSSDSRLTTRDYYKLCEPLFLREYELELRHYPHLPKCRPFYGWDASKPTQSLTWYDAYNAVKHDRANMLHRATLRHCIEALAAATAMYCAQFSIPSGIDWMHDAAFELNDWFKVELINSDPATFYVPPVHVPLERVAELWFFDGRNTGSWNPTALNLA